MFKRTLVSLTLQYSTLLLLLFAVFSAGLFTYTVHTFDSDYFHELNSNDTSSQNSTAHDITDKDTADLRLTLFITYGGLLVCVPPLSYWLARRSLRPVVESYKVQQQFVNNASHELRTPLSAIQGELELALARPRSKGEYMAAIRTSLDGMSGLVSLVDHLLLLARGNSEQLYTARTAVQAKTLVTQAVEIVRMAHNQHTPRFKINMDKQLEMQIIPDLAQRALVNVLDNAVKFTPQHGAITITAEASEQAITLRVRDTGKGMNEAQAERAFDRFWRAETARSVEGFGLGLALVRQIMELHHGNAELTSRAGHGTEVRLRFPR